MTRNRRLLIALVLPAIVLVATVLLRSPSHPTALADIDPTHAETTHGSETPELAVIPPTEFRSAPDADGETEPSAANATDPSTPTAPGAVGDLRPLHAVLVHKLGTRPLAHLDVAVIDSRGTRVDVTSDAQGRVRSDTPLMVGTLQLILRPDQLPPGELFDGLEITQDKILLGTHGLVGVTHSASAEPDVWPVILIHRRLALHLTGTSRTDSDARYTAHATAGLQWEMVALDMHPRDDLPDAEWLVIVSHMMNLNGWRVDQIDQAGGKRLLHVVERTNTTVAVGTTRVRRIPHARLLPLEVTLTPLTSRDLPDLNTRYGPRLGGELRRALLISQGRADDAESAAFRVGLVIEGTVRSQSGTFRGPLRIRALPTGPAPSGAASTDIGTTKTERPLRRGEADVTWSEDGIGHFVIDSLDATTYELTPSAASKRLHTRPRKVEVTAPIDLTASPEPVFMVLDQLAVHAVAVHAQASDGSWLGGFEVALIARHEGQTITRTVVARPVDEAGSKPKPAIASRAVPSDAELEVEITLDGYSALKLARHDFRLENGMLHALAILTPATPAPDENDR